MVSKGTTPPKDESEGRTTDELIEVLSQDFHRLNSKMMASVKRDCFSEINAAQARNLVSCLFVLVEGVAFVLKASALRHFEDRGKSVPLGANELVVEARYDIDKRGKIIGQSERIKLEQNVMFAFRFYSEAYGVATPLDTSSDWWRALKGTQLVRDRLTHPRMLGDLDVTASEILDAVIAEAGLRECVRAALKAARKAKSCDVTRRSKPETTVTASPSETNQH